MSDKDWAAWALRQWAVGQAKMTDEQIGQAILLVVEPTPMPLAPSVPEKSDSCAESNGYFAVKNVGWAGHSHQCTFTHNFIRCTSLRDHIDNHVSLAYNKVLDGEHWRNL